MRRHTQTIAESRFGSAEIEEEFAASVVEGLSKRQKSLPCRYFYDARGSALFEEITRLPEYYPTRTEARIRKDHAAERGADIRAGEILGEFGSGSRWGWRWRWRFRPAIPG